MAASLNVAAVDGAPGNVITLIGSGLTAGAGASVTLANQGVTDPPNLAATTLTLPATFDGTSVAIGPLPDGITSGTLTVTAADASTATCSLRAVSQYVQAAEFLGEGIPTSGLAATTVQGVSELDLVLRRASSIIDSYIGGQGVRLLQVMEQPKYKAPIEGMAPRIYPWRTSGRRVPILSSDQLNFVSAAELVTTFNNFDLYVNSNLNYVEILAYAIGNYALLGELQTIGYSANVYHFTFTSGYGWIAGSYTRTYPPNNNQPTTVTYQYDAYPQEIRDATTIMATALLKQRALAAMNMGDVKSFKKNMVMETDWRLPQSARILLQPYIARKFA